MNESNFKWAVVENIVIYLIIAILFWFTRSPWVFLFFLFVNTSARPKSHARNMVADAKKSAEFKGLE